MEEARQGVWDHADWKAALAWTTPQTEMDPVRRATRLGEPLGSDSFLKQLEAKAGRRLRVHAQGRPAVEKSGVVGAGQQSLFAD